MDPKISRTIIVLNVWLLTAGTLPAQTKNNSIISNDYYSNYTPNMPTQAALGSFGNYPINYYTGLPEISFNLMTLTSRDLSLPISINYDATGVRLDDISGTVGLKWNLNAGGVIIRQLNGLPDESPNGYWLNENAINNTTPSPSLGKSWVQSSQVYDLDCEPDEFVAYIGGRSIKFFIKNGTPQPLPRQNVIISHTLINNKLNKFVITTEDGMKYTFGSVSTAIEERKIETLNIKVNFIYSVKQDTHDYWDDYYGYFVKPFYSFFVGTPVFETYSCELSEKGYPFYNSKWYLTTIQSPTGDQITLNYTNLGLQKFVTQPTINRKEPFLTTISDFTYTRHKCIDQHWWGCNRYEDLTWNHSDWVGGTKAYAAFTNCQDYDMNCASNYPQSVTMAQGGFIDPTDTPGELMEQVDPQNIYLTQSLVTESVIRLDNITTNVGNKITFSSSARTDLPNAIKYDRIDLFAMNSSLVKSIKLNYSTIESNNPAQDYMWISEAIMLDRISSTGLKFGANHAFSAYDVKAKFTENDIDKTSDQNAAMKNLLCKKYIFEGLKAYNYTRLYLDNIQEMAGSATQLMYAFEYSNRDLLLRRITPMQNYLGYSRSYPELPPNPWTEPFQPEPPFRLQNSETVRTTNTYDPAMGRPTLVDFSYTRGMLEKIKYPSGGSTIFGFGGNYPKLNQILDNDVNDVPVSVKTIEYKPLIIAQPVFVSYQNDLFYDKYRRFKITSSAPQNHNFSYSHGVPFPSYETKVWNGYLTHQGYEIFKFRSDADIITPVESATEATVTEANALNRFPFPKNQDKDHIRGLLNEHSVYDENNRPVKTTINTWVIDPNGYLPQTLKGFIGGSFPYNHGDAIYRWGRYPIIFDWITLQRTEEIIYDGTTADLTKNFSTYTDYAYDPVNLQLTETQTYNKYDLSQKLISKTKYVTHSDYNNASASTNVNCEEQLNTCLSGCNSIADLSQKSACIGTCYNTYYNICNPNQQQQGIAITKLRNDHQISVPVESQTFIEANGLTKIISAIVYKYVKLGSPVAFIKPQEMLGLKQALDPSSYSTSAINGSGAFIPDSKMRTLQTYDNYDPANGNIITQTSIDGIVSSYQWGFNNSLVTGLTINPGAQQQQLYYDHYPLVGVKTATDQNGRTMSFAYDGFDRLKLSKDHDGNILARYRYNYGGRGFNPEISVVGPLYRGESLTISSVDKDIDYGTSSHAYTFGDGGTATSSTGSNVNHTYASAGTYTISVQKTNPEYPSANFSKNVTIYTQPTLEICADGPQTINNCGPTAMVWGSCTQQANHTVTSQTILKATFSGGCPAASPPATITYTWEFQKDSDPWMTLGIGQQVVAPAGFLFRTIGNYTIRCRATDPCGKEVSSTTLLLAIFQTC
jgi:YD repeat-containing protein